MNRYYHWLTGRKLSRIAALLQSQWGAVSEKPLRPPLDELVLTILSQNTSDLNSDRAFRSLRRAMSDWNEVRKAPAKKIEAAIREGGLARIKANRIQAILEEIHREWGVLSLDFLKDLPPENAWAYLRRFKGVGPKTAACVMLFSLGRPAFPVDTHIIRVLSRMGEGQKWTPEGLQEELQRKAPSELMYPLHLHLIHHGRMICRPRNPLCGRCSLISLCNHGKKLVG